MTPSPEKSVVQEAEALLEKITPGEWDWASSLPGSGGNWNEDPSAYEPAQVHVTEDDPICYMDGARGEDQCDRNAEFIAAAPRLVRELLAEQHRLEAENRSLRNQLAEAQAQLQWVGECIEDQDVSHFAESFPLIRAVADLKAELRSLREASAGAQWQPIETAPKDGSNFIAYTSHGEMLFTAHWNAKDGRWFTDYELWSGRMTHWMPLPSPLGAPAATSQEKP